MSKPHLSDDFAPNLEPESGVPMKGKQEIELPESPQTLKRKKDFDKEITNEIAMTSNDGSPSRSPDHFANQDSKNEVMRFYPEDEEPKS